MTHSTAQKNAHMLSLRFLLLYPRPDRACMCLVSRKTMSVGSNGDIHEAIFKRNRIGKKLQDKNYDLIFSPFNCSLLDHEAHLGYGQDKMLSTLHIWNCLTLGMDMEAWVNEFPLKEKKAEVMLVHNLAHQFHAGDPLTMGWSYGGPGSELVWPVEDNIWHYAHEELFQNHSKDHK